MLEFTAEIFAKSSLIVSSTTLYYSVLFNAGLVELSVEFVILVLLLLVSEVFVWTPSKKFVIISYLSNVSSYREAGNPLFKV